VSPLTAGAFGEGAGGYLNTLLGLHLENRPHVTMTRSRAGRKMADGDVSVAAACYHSRFHTDLLVTAGPHD
jgi:hypothetical protein